jgi:hypothetical protein
MKIQAPRTPWPRTPVNQIERFYARNIPVRTDPIASLEGEGRHLKRITFVRGRSLDRVAIFFATGCHQASNLSQRLGCERDEKGGVITDPATEETISPCALYRNPRRERRLLVARFSSSPRLCFPLGHSDFDRTITLPAGTGAGAGPRWRS